MTRQGNAVSLLIFRELYRPGSGRMDQFLRDVGINVANDLFPLGMSLLSLLVTIREQSDKIFLHIFFPFL